MSNVLNPFMDSHLIKILNQAILEGGFPDSANQTAGGHSMYFDKNRKVVFLPTRDDSSGNK